MQIQSVKEELQMRYLGLIVMAFGCSQEKSLSDGEFQDSDDQLLGDSNVFLDDPTIELDAADQSESPIDTARKLGARCAFRHSSPAAVE